MPALLDSPRRLRAVSTWITALAVATALLGAAAALIVPPGLPYDEPAHWANVLFYAGHGRMPILGEPGVQYEGQQTPAYYAAAAVIALLAGKGSAGLLAVRLFGVLGAVALTVLVAGILQRTTRDRPVVVILGTAFIALNPMLIVMSASVQNDTWALVAGFGAMLVAMRARPESAWTRGLAIGLLGALAILVKVSLAPLVIGVVLVLLWRRRVAEAAAAVVVVAAACGWWVVRNLLLYGDFTGQAGVEATGYHFGTGGLGPAALAREALTYLTLPTEYLRNTISAPTWVDAIVIALGAAIVAGLVVAVVRGRTFLRAEPTAIVVVVAALSVGAWLVQVTLGWQVAFRTAYGALPLVALAYGACALAARGRSVRLLRAILLTLLLVLLLWTGAAIVSSAHLAMLVP